MDEKTVYHLCLELLYASGKSISNSQGLKMAGARKGILRDILVPGNMSLRDLHAAIQKAFGWHDIHLHKFGLCRQDFDLLTEGSADTYKKLCGTLFRYNSGGSSDWCRHVLFDSPMYGLEPVRLPYTAEDSFFVNRLLADFAPLSKSMRISSLSHAGASRTSGDTSANTLAERLSIDELFTPENDKKYYIHDRCRLENWRQSLFSLSSNALEKIYAFKAADPCGFAEACSSLDEMEAWKKSFSLLMKISSNPAAVLSRFGRTADKAFEYHREMLLECLGSAKKLISAYNPVVTPYFSSVTYWYDKGDEWCVRVSCRNIFRKSSVEKSVRELCSEDMVFFNCLQGVSEASAAEGYTAGNKISAAPQSAANTCCWMDKDNSPSKGIYAEQLDTVSVRSQPLCVAADGLDVMDDIGGIEGYFDFLKTLHGSDRREAMRVMELAGIYGWSGKKPEPGSILPL